MLPATAITAFFTATLALTLPASSATASATIPASEIVLAAGQSTASGVAIRGTLTIAPPTHATTTTGVVLRSGMMEIALARYAPPTCPGDINDDGSTNALDFNILAGNFGGAVAANTLGDLNSDGVVNTADFVILASDFGCDG